MLMRVMSVNDLVSLDRYVETNRQPEACGQLKWDSIHGDE
jgi:hypothetical protein